VEEALCAAWDSLRTHPRPGFDLLTANEDDITQELYETLYDSVFNKSIVPGFDRQLFTVVTREAKVRNYDRTMLDKMPDLLIGLTDRHVYRSTQDWLFIECKPVDIDHSAGVHYCDKGIIRFVRGEYAWAMTSALMIGYTRNGYTILSKLVKSLEKRIKEIPTISMPHKCAKSRVRRNSDIVHISQHGRTFTYIETGQQAPDIIIRHLWLHRD
jgi:hypothetical protein